MEKERKIEYEGIPRLYEELQQILEFTGYKIISIGAEHTDMNFSGAINLQIAPASWIRNTDYVNFPHFSQNFLAHIREYAAQCSLSMDGISGTVKV